MDPIHTLEKLKENNPFDGSLIVKKISMFMPKLSKCLKFNNIKSRAERVPLVY